MWKRETRPLAPGSRHTEGGLPLEVAPGENVDLPQGVTAPGRTMIIKGELSADEHLIIDGRVEGRIVMPDHGLAIGRHATVEADVLARTMTVLGVAKGNLIVAETTDIRDTASVEGRLVSSRVAMAEGAQFKGTVDTKRAEAAVQVARYRVKRNGMPTAAQVPPQPGTRNA